MPATSLRFYQEAPGNVPVQDWLKSLRKKDKKAYAKCLAFLRMLSIFGHELRRPHADSLRDGIGELRVRCGRVNYRLLYFMHGRDVAILVHSLTKEDVVPKVDIDRALERKKPFE